ncbi:hypothetical protein CEXT_329831, partial [Caerostris extrusa]
AIVIQLLDTGGVLRMLSDLACFWNRTLTIIDKSRWESSIQMRPKK